MVTITLQINVEKDMLRRYKMNVVKKYRIEIMNVLDDLNKSSDVHFKGQMLVWVKITLQKKQ